MPLKRSYSVTSYSNYLDLTEYTINTDFFKQFDFFGRFVSLVLFFLKLLYMGQICSQFMVGITYFHLF